MSKKRNVYLFGAGAVIDWGGPKTIELTSSIRKSGFNCNDNQTKITEFIYRTLIETGFNDHELNFETIINIIEELIIYYSYSDKVKGLASLNKSFFSSRFEDIILNFSIEGGQEKHLYKLEIPKGVEYHFSKSAYNKESPEQFYFQHLLAELLTNINSLVSKYSYHTKGNSVIDQPEKQEINKSFQKCLQKHSDNSIIRMYTLNYDRVFKILLEKVGIPVFDGFEYGEFVSQNGVLPDVKKILSDDQSNIHFNLHGSAFWQVNARDEYSQLYDPWISLNKGIKFEMNNTESAILQIDKGKNLLVSNIITGFQKAQKSFITPFKQMQASFDRDCFDADDLYIIGYSFSDEHINASIKSALKYNEKVNIHLIDPAYDDEEGKSGHDLLINKFINVFTYYLKNKGFPNKINDKCSKYFHGKLTVCSMGIKEYLSSDLSVI
jgi:hypothetical protein